MTFSIKQNHIGNHYIAIEIDKAGLVTVWDGIASGDIVHTIHHKATYSADDMKNATATYNRYCRNAKKEL